jgi:hypothetical protein
MIGAIIGTIAIVLVTIVIGLIVDRKAPLLPTPEDLAPDRKKLETHAAGEAPSTAIRVRDAQLDRLRASQRCPRCRSKMESAPDDHVRYNDADLLVCHFKCVNCPGFRTLYVSTR